MTVTSGRRCAALLRSFTPVGCLLRMCLASSIWHSTRCLLTWKAKATKSGRLYFQLAVSVRGTSDNVSGFWPTAQAQMPGAGPDNAKVKNLLTGSRHSFYLTHAVEAERQKPGIITGLLPTPTDVSKGGGSSRSGDRINETPTLHGMARKGMLPTPKARDWKGQSQRGEHAPGDALCNALKTTGGRLNPNFVEFLMGYPQDWTKVE